MSESELFGPFGNMEGLSKFLSTLDEAQRSNLYFLAARGETVLTALLVNAPDDHRKQYVQAALTIFRLSQVEEGED